VRRFLLVLCLFAVVGSGCAVGVRQPASNVTGNSATLNGKVLSTTGGAGSYFIEYGPTTARTERTPTRPIEFVVNESEPVAEPVDGLEPGTIYHYAVCAEDSENPGDPFCSPDQTFTTDATEDSVAGAVDDEPCQPPIPSGEICRSFRAFDSHSGPAGENPTGTVTIQYAVRSESVVRDYPVSCLVVEGNRATVAIVGDFSETVVVYVEDNGSAGQDRIAVTDELFSPPPDFECPPPVAPSDARTVGSDIVVTDAQPQTGAN